MVAPEEFHVRIAGKRRSSFLHLSLRLSLLPFEFVSPIVSAALGFVSSIVSLSRSVLSPRLSLVASLARSIAYVLGEAFLSLSLFLTLFESSLSLSHIILAWETEIPIPTTTIQQEKKT